MVQQGFFSFYYRCSNCQMRGARALYFPRNPRSQPKSHSRRSCKIAPPWVPPEHAVAIWVRDGTGQYSPQEKAEHLVDEHPQHGPFWWCSWCEQHNSKLLIVVYPFLFGENSEKDNATTKSRTSRQVQKILPSQQVRLLHQSLLAGWTISQGPGVLEELGDLQLVLR